MFPSASRWLFLVCAAVPVLASAQVPRDRVEKAVDRRALRTDRRETRDDWRDLARLEATLKALEEARAKQDSAAVGRAQSAFVTLLGKESAEGMHELRKDRQEVRQDRAELGSDRRELVKDNVTGRPLQAADDRRDLRDDRRDLRDDKRDARVEARAELRILAIRDEAAALVGKVDPASVDRSRALMVEAISLAKSELAQDGAERREDRRELREDRRETREDRRQR